MVNDISFICSCKSLKIILYLEGMKQSHHSTMQKIKNKKWPVKSECVFKSTGLIFYKTLLRHMVSHPSCTWVKILTLTLPVKQKKREPDWDLN